MFATNPFAPTGREATVGHIRPFSGATEYVHLHLLNAPMTSYPASLDRLWALTGQPLAESGVAYSSRHFDEIGLLLSLPLKPSEYGWCAPTNVLRFAETGGDGVQFGLLLLDETLSEDSPVIMTVPMAMGDKTSFVVGENLSDFLALGCRRGYFILEQLAYRPDWLLSELADEEFGGDMSDQQKQLLGSLSAAFGLSSWGERTANRLKWLEDEYFELLALPPPS